MLSSSEGEEDVEFLYRRNMPIPPVPTPPHPPPPPLASPATPSMFFPAPPDAGGGSPSPSPSVASVRSETPRKGGGGGAPEHTGVCEVCGDGASGHHYGVFSCEACKAFFKRTVQGSIEYFCPAVNNCQINKSRRKSCQACRFKKCLLVGMMREGVRPDRVRGGRQKYYRDPVPSPLDPLVSSYSAPSQLQGMRANLIQQLVAIEPPRVQFCRPDLRLKSGVPEVKAAAERQVLCLLADQSLVETIAWAKQVPGFTDMSAADQMSQIHNSWLELLVLGVCVRSLDCAMDYVLRYATDAEVDVTRCTEALQPFNKACWGVLDKLHRLNITPEESAVLKAIVLCSADALDTEDVSKVERLQSVLNDSLRDYINSRYPGDRRRLARILMVTVNLRQSAVQTARCLSTVLSAITHTEKHIFVEMLPKDLSTIRDRP